MTIAQIDRIEGAGAADAFEINISQLELNSLRDVFSCTNRPCIATNRRAQFMKVYGYKDLRPIDDELRADRLLEAFEQGAKAIDFELDMFDENRTLLFGSKQEAAYASKWNATPRQVTQDTHAIRKQRNLVRRIESSGGEVVISCHAQVRLRRETAIGLARAIQRRGANFAKLVMMTFGYDDLVELQITAQLLKSRLSIPFNLMNDGDYAVLGRLLSILGGSSWVYCRTEAKHSYRGQPTIGEAKLFLKQNFSKC